MPYIYIGKTTYFKGKSLWEILGNLKSFGVGRVLVRSRFEHYPEPSYIRVKKVLPDANPENPTVDNMRVASVFVERVFRGQRYPDTVIKRASYKADYRLIPKDEEAQYCRITEQKQEEKIYPRTTVFPPLMRELILREAKASGAELKEEPQLTLKYQVGVNNHVRVAGEGETPNVDFAHVGLGTPASPSLYEGIKLNKNP